MVGGMRTVVENTSNVERREHQLEPTLSACLRCPALIGAYLFCCLCGLTVLCCACGTVRSSYLMMLDDNMLSYVRRVHV